MKSALSIALLGVVLASSQAFADNYGTAGCGLGAMAFKDRPGKIQIAAATVNNLVSPQTFAITSGTSNCTDDANTASAMFINVNQVALRKDIARGTGESVASLSKIMKCSDSEIFGNVLQKNYQSIFPTEKASPEQISKSIATTIHNDAKLSQSCG